jgi:hypothetical protein
MKKEEKLWWIIFISLIVGLSTMTLGWTHFATYVLGVLIYAVFVAPFGEE